MPANENTPDHPELSSRFVNGRLLRCGYTTGSCAAAWMLLTRSKRETYTLVTPKGIALTLDILNASYDSDTAVCTVKKNAGDDPDVTRGVLIYGTAILLFIFAMGVRLCCMAAIYTVTKI